MYYYCLDSQGLLYSVQLFRLYTVYVQGISFSVSDGSGILKKGSGPGNLAFKKGGMAR